MRKLLAILAFVLFTVSWVEALTLQKYLHIRKEDNTAYREVAELYIGGIGEGLIWANTKADLFCPPGKLALQEKNFVDILDRTIDRYKDTDIFNSKKDADIIGLILLIGLQQTFPCDKK